MPIVTWSFPVWRMCTKILGWWAIRGNWRAIGFLRPWTLESNKMIQSTTSWNSLVYKNRIWRRDFWRMVSSNSGPISRLPSAARRTNSFKQERHLVSPLKFLTKNLDLTESEEPNTDSFPSDIGWNSKQWYQVLSVSSEEEKNRCNETRIVTPPSLVAPIPSVIFWHSS